MSENHILIRNLHRYVHVYVCECTTDSIWRSPAFSLLLTKVCNYWEDWEHVERLCVHRSGHVLCISGPTSDGASSRCPCSAAAYNRRMQSPASVPASAKRRVAAHFHMRMQNVRETCSTDYNAKQLPQLWLSAEHSQDPPEGVCSHLSHTRSRSKTHFSESLCVSPEKDYVEESLQFNSYTA